MPRYTETTLKILALILGHFTRTNTLFWSKPKFRLVEWELRAPRLGVGVQFTVGIDIHFSKVGSTDIHLLQVEWSEETIGHIYSAEARAPEILLGATLCSGHSNLETTVRNVIFSALGHIKNRI